MSERICPFCANWPQDVETRAYEYGACDRCGDRGVLPESSFVASGHVVVLGGIPGVMDAHVRKNMLLLRCERNWITGAPIEPWQIHLNGDDMDTLAKLIAWARGQQ